MVPADGQVLLGMTDINLLGILKSSKAKARILIQNMPHYFRSSMNGAAVKRKSQVLMQSYTMNSVMFFQELGILKACYDYR